MTDKLYQQLTEAIRVKEKIEVERAKRESLLHGLLPSGIAYDGIKVQTSPTETFSNTMASVAEIDDRIRALDSDYAEACKRVMTLLDVITNSLYKRVMIELYIGGKSARDVAISMNYTEDGIHKIRRRMTRVLEKCLVISS